jgi:CRISPR/Cas system-associated exonuclease Cas4 (RecB family)
MNLPLNINWSYSKLDAYENCAYQFKLRYIDKSPELPRPPDNPLERGNRVHDRLEKFVKEGGPMDTEARQIDKFVPKLDHLRDLYACGMATAEDNWFFDKDWTQCKRDQVWLWSKLDFNVEDRDNAHSIIGDYKTGKSGYKTINHIQQMQLYAAAVALRQPWAERITVELWYLDEGWIRQQHYTHEQAMKFVGIFDRRAQRIYADRFFRPNPNKVTCRYCPFNKSSGTGACAVAAL